MGTAQILCECNGEFSCCIAVQCSYNVFFLSLIMFCQPALLKHTELIYYPTVWWIGYLVYFGVTNFW